VRLAVVATTSFRDACAQPGLSLAEIAHVVDCSVTLAAGEKDFVTALFAEFGHFITAYALACSSQLTPAATRSARGPARQRRD
jgi:hypothetical protein